MPAIVEHSGAIGFVASALVLGAFGMKDMVNLRIVAICSNIAFIAYALVLSLPPILILHIILLPLNGWRLMEALKQRSAAHAPLLKSRRGATLLGRMVVAAGPAPTRR